MEKSVPTTCPRCWKPMEGGFAAFNSSLFWNNEPKTLYGFRRSDMGDKVLTKKPWITSNIPAFLCSNCKLVLMDYSSEAADAPT